MNCCIGGGGGGGGGGWLGHYEEIGVFRLGSWDLGFWRTLEDAGEVVMDGMYGEYFRSENRIPTNQDM